MSWLGIKTHLKSVYSEQCDFFIYIWSTSLKHVMKPLILRQNRCILGACSGNHREQNTAPIVKIFIPDHLHTWRLTQKKTDQKILNKNIFSGPVITAAFTQIFYKSEASTGFTLVSTINETWAEKLKMSLGRTGSGVWSLYNVDL